MSYIVGRKYKRIKSDYKTWEGKLLVGETVTCKEKDEFGDHYTDVDGIMLYKNLDEFWEIQPIEFKVGDLVRKKGSDATSETYRIVTIDKFYIHAINTNNPMQSWDTCEMHKVELVPEEPKHRLKVGDRVRVKKDLKEGYHYGTSGNGYCNKNMLEFQGKEFTVTKLSQNSHGEYVEGLDDWCWYYGGNSMIEPVAPCEISGKNDFWDRVTSKDESIRDRSFTLTGSVTLTEEGKKYITSILGENTMELKELQTKNLQEAKKQFDSERNNAEIEFAKKELRRLTDAKDDLLRDIKNYSELIEAKQVSVKDIEKQLKLFGKRGKNK